MVDMYINVCVEETIFNFISWVCLHVANNFKPNCHKVRNDFSKFQSRGPAFVSGYSDDPSVTSLHEVPLNCDNVRQDNEKAEK